ncbi:MAG: extracellular solute-binding protein [Anaerolineales bacterium]|nr:extracellular solute-binding protein [Anaerolineales bacterium]
MKRTHLPWLTILLSVALLLSACGGPATQAPAPTEAVSEPPAQPAGEKITIRFWSHQNDAFNEGYQALADAYSAEHPNVEIQFETFDYDTYIQTLQTALPAKTEADILQMFGSWVCSYVEGGNLAEAPASLISIDQAKAQIFGAPLGGYLCNDKLYGIPQEFNIEYGAALVNTALAQEIGMSTDGWADWDAFIADAKKLAIVQDGVMTRAAFNFTGSDGIATMFHSLILQHGGQYLADGVYQVDTPEGQKTLELMKRLVDEGLVDPVLFNDEENWVGDSFFEETSAIGLVGPWVVPEYGVDYPEMAENAIYVPLPSVGEKPLFAAASGWGLTVSANSKVQEAAWDFIRFVALDPANAVQWNLASGTLPAIADNASGANAEALVAEFPYFEPFLGLLEYGQYEGQFPDRDFVWYEVAYPRVLNFLQGNATLEETLKTIESEVQGSF